MNNTRQPRKFRPLIFMYMLGGAAFTAVLAWLIFGRAGGDGGSGGFGGGVPTLRPTDPVAEDPFERATKIAINTADAACKPYKSVEERKEISTELSVSLRKVAAGGKTSRKTIEEAIDGTLSETGKLKESEGARACMVKAIADNLDRAGFLASPGSPPPPPPAVLIDSKTKHPAEGFSYVEELDGAPTRFGPFLPYGSEKALPYGEINKGTLLETTMEAHIRRLPGGAAPDIGRIGVGACVEVLEDANLPQRNPNELKNATSGGHLRVRSVKCP